jgi:hypothetical protein
MGDRLDSTINSLLKDELLHIAVNTTAILKPQSEKSKQIYSLYYARTSEYREHNYHVYNAPAGCDVEEIKVPSLKEYVITQLTEHGYNKNRFQQLMINDRNRFEEDDEFDSRLGKYMDDMQSICSHAHTIAKYLVANDMAMVQQELNILVSRFEVFFPNTGNDLSKRLNDLEDNVIASLKPDISEVFECKPSFLGVGLNFNAIYLRIKNRFKSG